MNKKKGFSKKNTNFSFLKDEQNPNRKKEQTSKESTVASSTLNIANNPTKTSNDIIDIDDSPDIATWNKEVTRNKDVSNNIDNKYRITKINPKIPTITTSGLERKREEDGNEKDQLIDPANQQEIDNAYHAGDKLTDQVSFFHNKIKLNNKSKESQ